MWVETLLGMFGSKLYVEMCVFVVAGTNYCGVVFSVVPCAVVGVAREKLAVLSLAAFGDRTVNAMFDGGL